MITALVTYFTTKNTTRTDVMFGIIAFFGCVVDVTLLICLYKLLKPLIQ